MPSPKTNLIYVSPKCYFKTSNDTFLTGTHVAVTANSKSEAEALAVEEIKKNRGASAKIYSLDCRL